MSGTYYNPQEKMPLKSGRTNAARRFNARRLVKAGRDLKTAQVAARSMQLRAQNR
jgi:hypothetical protein